MRSEEKVFRAVTDNGSNMVKTFTIKWIEENIFDGFHNSDKDIQEILLETEDASEVADYELEEMAINSKLKKYKINRFGCFIHMLQWIIKADKN